MLVKLKLLTVIKNEAKHDYYTFYFFNKDANTILPIEILRDTQYPPIYDTYLRTLHCFKSSIKCIKVYLVRDEIFYAYVSIKNRGCVFDLNCNIRDALELFGQTKCAIYTSEKIVREIGIKVTKQLVLSSLENC